MPQKSTIKKLDPRIREEIDRIIRIGNYTIDGLVETLKGMGGEASRSAVGRYAANVEKQMETYRQAQEMAKAMVGQLKEDSEGNTARMLVQLTQNLIFKQLDKLADSERTGAMDVSLISRAMKDIASTDKLTLERIERIKDITRKEAADAVTKVQKKAGLSDETAEAIRRQILGLPARA